MPNIIFDATTNLRAVLDQTGFAAAAALHRGAPKNAYFPIADDEIGLENVIKRKRCKDLPPRILTLFKTFKPYRGGNNVIWTLNKLANNKKHASLAPVSLGGFGITGGELKITFVEGGDGPEIGFWWDPEKNEVTFIRAGLNTQIEYNTSFFFEVTFDPALDILGGHEPVRVLNAMAAEVERVLSATEFECRQLGLTL